MTKIFKMLLPLFILFVAFAPNVIAAGEVADQNFKARELPAVKAEKASGKDAHIKSGKSANTAGKPKSKPTTRASGWGAFRIYNKTGFFMDVYEDGAYVGTVSPYSYATWTAFGNTSMYCKIEFDNGEYLSWTYAADVQTGEIVYAAPTM